MRKWSPTFRSKSVNGKTKLNLMETSVWASVLWGSALWTMTKAMKSAIDSWCAYGQYDGEDQERCRRGGGSMVEKIPSRWARGVEETKPVAVKHTHCLPKGSPTGSPGIACDFCGGLGLCLGVEIGQHPPQKRRLHRWHLLIGVE